MKFDTKNYFNAFLFSSIYAALLFAIVLAIDDYLDNKVKNIDIKTKGIIHSVSIFIISLILLLILWKLFGWGTGWVPNK